jgi:hypothetical protein
MGILSVVGSVFNEPQGDKVNSDMKWLQYKVDYMHVRYGVGLKNISCAPNTHESYQLA